MEDVFRSSLHIMIGPFGLSPMVDSRVNWGMIICSREYDRADCQDGARRRTLGII